MVAFSCRKHANLSQALWSIRVNRSQRDCMGRQPERLEPRLVCRTRLSLMHWSCFPTSTRLAVHFAGVQQNFLYKSKDSKRFHIPSDSWCNSVTECWADVLSITNLLNIHVTALRVNTQRCQCNVDVKPLLPQGGLIPWFVPTTWWPVSCTLCILTENDLLIFSSAWSSWMSYRFYRDLRW